MALPETTELVDIALAAQDPDIYTPLIASKIGFTRLVPNLFLLNFHANSLLLAKPRPKLSSSATATNARRWRSSMPSGAWGKGRTLAG